MSVGRNFKALLTALEPGEAELEEAERHARSIKSRLGAAFDVKKFDIVGSHDRGSGIARLSDVDYFAVVSRNEARWGGGYVSSTTVLDRVRRELADRFESTRVRRDGPAVVVRFGRGAFPVDVVPAIYSGPHATGWPIYEIADGDGDWMLASPGYHTRSCFIEHAVFNVPNDKFNLADGAYYDDVRASVAHLWNAARDAGRSAALVQVDGMLKLFRPGEAWSPKSLEDFALAAWQHVGFTS